MEAIRLHPNADTSNPYSDASPAPSSALVFEQDLPVPQLTEPGQLLVRVKATTVIRDSLTWPESYTEKFKIMGNDFAGTVVAVSEKTKSSNFKAGDEIYGMTDAARAGAWAEYTIVYENEACLKPKSLTWAQAAAVPLSALTAYQALFEKANIPAPDFNLLDQLRLSDGTKGAANKSTLLVTGASGGVGLYMVQLARLTGLHVVAVTRSNSRNKELLEKLGANEVSEYTQLPEGGRRYDYIIDIVGGDVLKSCWQFIKKAGTLVSIDSASYDFVKEHQDLGLSRGCENVKALFFVVSASKENLDHLSTVLDAKLLEPFVADEMPLADARLAYDKSMKSSASRGKIVLTPRPDLTAQT